MWLESFGFRWWLFIDVWVNLGLGGGCVVDGGDCGTSWWAAKVELWWWLVSQREREREREREYDEKEGGGFFVVVIF